MISVKLSNFPVFPECGFVESIKFYSKIEYFLLLKQPRISRKKLISTLMKNLMLQLLQIPIQWILNFKVRLLSQGICFSVECLLFLDDLHSLVNIGEDEEVDADGADDDDDVPNPVPAPVLAPLPIVNLPRAGIKRKRPGKRGKKDVLLWEVWEEEDQRWIDQHLTEDVDLDQQNAVIAETLEPPPELIMPLLRYQKEFLAWASKQEQSVAGGILADEMGMGKTIQAISLVLARREVDRARFGKAVGCTLVLCPLVAVSQWSNEIDRFTSPGSTKVLVYHGAKREKNVKELMKYDFVLTTYSTAENEFRRCMMSPKVQCEYCDKSFYPKSLTIHHKYHCGPSAVKTEKQSKQNKKNSAATSSKQANVKEKRSRKKAKQTLEEDQCGPVDREKSLLHSVKWNRIILDEVSTKTHRLLMLS